MKTTVDFVYGINVSIITRVLAKCLQDYNAVLQDNHKFNHRNIITYVAIVLQVLSITLSSFLHKSRA